MKSSNKFILSIYLIYAAIILLTGLINPSMTWKEKIFITSIMLISASFFAFMIYFSLHQFRKDQGEPQCNIVAKIFWKKYRKPFTLSFYFVGILIVGTSVFFMPELSLAWKSGVFAILFAVISGGFFSVYQTANQMLNRSCMERMPDEE
ncbi:hypothetical protein MOF05_13470 [Bacillus haynesii]|uniref:hypothetical protein n=1 Tax=Bacillus haynesii TaxID=1925021 RepID=UPI002281A155|nr:hypothetical protein [Bacillus haynesii]MCY9289392.1 hypothetical protein [Bacillus haynesii]